MKVYIYITHNKRNSVNKVLQSIENCSSYHILKVPFKNVITERRKYSSSLRLL